MKLMSGDGVTSVLGMMSYTVTAAYPGFPTNKTGRSLYLEGESYNVMIYGTYSN